MRLVTAELVSCSPPVVVQFLVWLLEFVRRPGRVWWQWTDEGWEEVR